MPSAEQSMLIGFSPCEASTTNRTRCSATSTARHAILSAPPRSLWLARCVKHVEIWGAHTRTRKRKYVDSVNKGLSKFDPANKGLNDRAQGIGLRFRSSFKKKIIAILRIKDLTNLILQTKDLREPRPGGFKERYLYSKTHKIQ